MDLYNLVNISTLEPHKENEAHKKVFGSSQKLVYNLGRKFGHGPVSSATLQLATDVRSSPHEKAFSIASSVATIATAVFSPGHTAAVSGIAYICSEIKSLHRGNLKPSEKQAKLLSVAIGVATIATVVLASSFAPLAYNTAGLIQLASDLPQAIKEERLLIQAARMSVRALGIGAFFMPIAPLYTAANVLINTEIAYDIAEAIYSICVNLNQAEKETNAHKTPPLLRDEDGLRSVSFSKSNRLHKRVAGHTEGSRFHLKNRKRQCHKNHIPSGG